MCDGTMGQRQYWVLDADISNFDSIDHRHLRSFLRPVDHRRRHSTHDRQMAEGRSTRRRLPAELGDWNPQGGVISPLLANIFLHHVLDEWLEVAQPRLSGRSHLVRYADDFVITLEDPESGRRMLGVLGRRLAKYGLTLHVDKTHYVDFRPHRLKGQQRSTSLALPMFGEGRGRATALFAKSRPRIVTRGR
ncbi:reverse transcriptase/maturase family protein [Mesorhizobium sp. M1233]|uniref:reverse transcriptase/maturase family protein n=1 Tax=Mesorhizobium sp. M1233 TaxID=2957072 RepID=UPI0033391FA9